LVTNENTPRCQTTLERIQGALLFVRWKQLQRAPFDHGVEWTGAGGQVEYVASHEPQRSATSRKVFRSPMDGGTRFRIERRRRAERHSAVIRDDDSGRPHERLVVLKQRIEAQAGNGREIERRDVESEERKGERLAGHPVAGAKNISHAPPLEQSHKFRIRRHHVAESDLHRPEGEHVAPVLVPRLATSQVLRRAKPSILIGFQRGFELGAVLRSQGLLRRPADAG
jgi:hypothetical protein